MMLYNLYNLFTLIKMSVHTKYFLYEKKKRICCIIIISFLTETFENYNFTLKLSGFARNINELLNFQFH